MEIFIKAQPYQDMRYSTCGDYWFDAEEGRYDIRVVETGNDDYDFLIMLHELIEMYLVKKRGISEPDIMAFDIKFDESDKEGAPGDEIDCPAYKEHQFAEGMERIMCNEMNIPWHTYSDIIDGLFEKASPDGIRK